MDQNNNNPNANANRFAGRAVPLDQRGPRFECRKCHQVVANLNRHEALCTGNVKPYRCPLCLIGYGSHERAQRHFERHHVGVPVPRFFLNPVYRRREVRERLAAAAPQPPQNQAPQNAAVPPAAPPEAMQQDQQQAADAGAEGEPVAGPAPPPAPNPPAPEPAAAAAGAPPAAAAAGGGAPPAAAAQPAAGVGGGVGAGGVPGPAQVPVGPPQGGNVGAFGELPLLLRYNLAANVRMAREAMGDDLAVVNLVLQILRDPAQFQLPG